MHLGGVLGVQQTVATDEQDAEKNLAGHFIH